MDLEQPEAVVTCYTPYFWIIMLTLIYYFVYLKTVCSIPSILFFLLSSFVVCSDPYCFHGGRPIQKIFFIHHLFTIVDSPSPTHTPSEVRWSFDCLPIEQFYELFVLEQAIELLSDIIKDFGAASTWKHHPGPNFFPLHLNNHGPRGGNA